jgi:hypothetical protein
VSIISWSAGTLVRSSSRSTVALTIVATYNIAMAKENNFQNGTTHKTFTKRTCQWCTALALVNKERHHYLQSTRCKDPFS